MKRGPKAPRTARRAVGGPKGPQPSAGARRKGAERPELLVCEILENKKIYALHAHPSSSYGGLGALRAPWGCNIQTLNFKL